MSAHIIAVDRAPGAPPSARRQLNLPVARRPTRQPLQHVHKRQEYRNQQPPGTVAADGRPRWRQWRHRAAEGDADGGSPAVAISLDDAPSSSPRPADTGTLASSSSRSSASSKMPGKQAAGAADRQQAGSQALPPAATEAQQQEEQQAEQGQVQERGQAWRLQWQLPEVPWALNTTVTLMVLWLCCFWATANTVVPNLLRWAGIEATASGSAAVAAESAAWVQVVKHSLLDSLQVATTTLLLRRGLSGYRPRQLGLFAAPLWPLRRWLLAVVAGVATFPFIDWVYKRMMAVLVAVEEQVVSTTADQILCSTSWGTQALWFGVLAVCAPIWEELMFRGFLLPSLARYLPHWASIAATALIFALVHFSRDGMLPLLLLGCVFGASYAFTRNLLAPIALHSLWNVYLLVQLLSSGGGAM